MVVAVCVSTAIFTIKTVRISNAQQLAEDGLWQQKKLAPDLKVTRIRLTKWSKKQEKTGFEFIQKGCIEVNCE